MSTAGRPRRDTDSLAGACRAAGLYAICQGSGVRVWLPACGARYPVPDGALLVLPGCDPAGEGRVWLWEQEGRRGRHPRSAVGGTAAAVAAFLAAAQPEGGQGDG